MLVPFGFIFPLVPTLIWQRNPYFGDRVCIRQYCESYCCFILALADPDWSMRDESHRGTADNFFLLYSTSCCGHLGSAVQRPFDIRRQMHAIEMLLRRRSCRAIPRTELRNPSHTPADLPLVGISSARDPLLLNPQNCTINKQFTSSWVDLG